MKKLLLIAIPIFAILVLAGIALTQSDSDNDADLARPHARPRPMLGDGLRLGIVLNDSGEKGAQVQEVLPDSPAEKAGIKKGDVIQSINGKKVDSSREVREFLRDMDEPKKMDIELLRDGKQIRVSATPEKREFPAMMKIFGGNYLGVNLQELDPDLASYFHADPKSGILIASVEKDSPAQKAGLRSGDIISEVNGKKVASPEDLRDALRDLKEGEEARLTVLRHGKEQQIVAHPEKRNFEDFRELRQLRDIPEMSKMRETLRDLPDRPEVRRSMEELRRQMDQLKEEIERDLKPQMEKLKQELQQLKKSD